MTHRRVFSSLVGVVCTLAVAVAMLGGQPVTAAAAHFRFVGGYSTQWVGGRHWLCYGWSNGAYHCTQWWHVSGGRYVSGNPRWVPSQTSGSNAAQSVIFKATSVKSSSLGLPLRTSIGQWSRTGYAAYTAWWGGDGYAFGQCTAGARYLSGNHIPTGLGDAKDWANNARRRGMAVGFTPRVGSTVVFQPGVQGASYTGHAGHVVAVYGNGWFMMEAENDYFDGGGFNRVDYRYAHAGPGVQFIY